MTTSSKSATLYPKERKPMLFIDRGTIKFKTKPVNSKDLALRFARCINANRRFTSPEVLLRRGSYVVVYQPSSKERQAALIARLQAERVQRAEEEQNGYFWNEQKGFAFCLSGSGSEYRVSLKFCQCRDFVDTCAPLGIHCKHQIAYANKYCAEQTSPRASLNINLDF